MAKKRGNGEGSIYQRKDKKWVAQMTVGRDPTTGKPKKRYFYGKTRNEVATKLNEAINKCNKGILCEPSKLTLAEWLDTWLLEYKKTNLRETTLSSYDYLINTHIKPVIGGILIKDLRPVHLQQFYNEKFQKGRIDGKGGLSSRTVRYIHIVIHEALEQARKNNIVPTNVSEATNLPKKQSKEMRVLTYEEQMQFLDSLEDDRLSFAFILALATGIRIGELLALKWENVDLDNKIIKIKLSLSRVKNFDENINTKTKLIFKEPKTKAGKRDIPIPDSVIKEFRKHKKRQNEEKLIAGQIYEDNDLVIATELGKPIDQRNLTRKFKSICKRADLQDVNFHALRHTYATRLLEANEHPKVVQEILGHSSISVTLDTYSHVMPEVKKAAASKINNLFIRKAPSTKEGTN